MIIKFTAKNISIGLMSIAVVLGVGLYTSTIKLPITREIHPQYVADFSDDRILMGAAHNVFVGKVIRQLGEKALGSSPETQFEVDVIFNIKGDLKENIVVNQFGGYKNGVLYLMHGGDVVSPGVDGGEELLAPGSTYLFVTRHLPEEDWYTFISHPNATKLLSKDGNLSKTDLQHLYENDLRITKLKEAYKNEVLLDSDVKNNNTRNSYQSLQEKN